MRYVRLLPLLLSTLTAPAWAGSPVNVNTADADELAAALDGVGMSKAQAIVEFRDAHGSFKHPDELVKVTGIGLATVNQNRQNIQVSDDREPPKEPRQER